MKHFLITALILPTLFLPTFATANCVERVGQAQQRILDVVGSLTSSNERLIQQVLQDLCTDREPGDSVVDLPNRRVIGTHGLNPARQPSLPATPPMILDVPVYADQQLGEEPLDQQ